MLSPTIVIEPSDSSIKIVVGYLLNKQPIVLYATSLSNNNLIKNGNIIDINGFADLLKVASHIEDKVAKVRFDINNAIIILPPIGLEVLEDMKSTVVASSLGKIESLELINVLGMMKRRFENLHSKNSIIDIVPLRYYLDKYKTDKLPLGVQSSVFGMKALIYTLPSMLNGAYMSAFKVANIKVSRTIIAPNAIAALLNENKDTPKVYIYADVGANYTSLSLISKNSVYNSSYFTLGGDELTSKISNEFNIDLKEAEKIKRRYGYNTRVLSFDPVIVNSNSQEEKEVLYTIQDLNRVCKDYLDNYLYSFDICLNKILSAYPEDKRNFPIIFGGGASRLDGFIKFMKEKYPNRKVSSVPLNVLGGRHEKYLNCIGAIVDKENVKNLYNAKSE